MHLPFLHPLPPTVTRRVLSATLGSLLGVGCYRDVPMPLDQLPPGSPVRALIVADPTVTSAFGGAAGGPAARTQVLIQGTLLERGAERVRFLVPASRTGATLAYAPFNQEISVARQDVLRVDWRRLEPKRTAGLVALIAGATVVAVLTASTEVGGTTSQPPTSGDVSVRGALPPTCCR